MSLRHEWHYWPEAAEELARARRAAQHVSVTELPRTVVAAGPKVGEGIHPEESRIVSEIEQQLETIYDPEIPVNIRELGLIYGIKLGADGGVHIEMTLTAPACPAAEQLPAEVEAKAYAVRGVDYVTVDIVWDPPWGPELMSEAAKLQLGFGY
jgi:FeS assembly SUF system protein